ncbi:hypothetical protein V8B97DRAFT_2061708 [Scleroderma yunnanense]
MDDSFKPPNLFDIENNPPSTRDKGKRKADGMDDLFEPPNSLDKENDKSYIPNIQDRGNRRVDDSLSMRTSTMDTRSDAALERYIRSYSPYMDDGFSTDTSTTSTPIVNVSEEIALTVPTGVIQQTNPSGLDVSMPSAEDVISSDESVYESAPQTEVQVGYEGETIEHLDDGDDSDLARSIKGFYRILDLIAEQGSGGLVDKVVISESPFQAFINGICPGAYSSVTRVNFKALDELGIKPIGIYGSKSQIVRLLSQLHVVDEMIAVQLLADNNDPHTQKILRSGLYILRPEEHTGPTEQIFLIYWPEQDTWSDSAPSAVSRNRTTFMRYLTKLCDQVVALMSPEHAQSIVWKQQDGDDDDSALDRDVGNTRIINCVVDRTTDQEESIKVRKGFKASSEYIILLESAEESVPHQVPPKSLPLWGETTQGFMTAKFVAGQRKTDLQYSFSELSLADHLKTHRLRISESLSAEELKILVRVGLKKRFPELCNGWERQSKDIHVSYTEQFEAEQSKAKAKVAHDSTGIQCTVHEAVVKEILQLYPSLDQAAFPYTDTQPEDTAAPCQPVALLYPNAARDLEQGLKKCTSNLDPKFRNAKDKICHFVMLAPRTTYLDSPIREQLLSAVVEGDLQGARAFLDAILQGGGASKKTTGGLFQLASSLVSRFIPKGKDDGYVVTTMQEAIRESQKATRNITDSQFLSDIVKREIVQSSVLSPLAEEAEKMAMSSLESTISHLVKKIVSIARRKQEEQKIAEIDAEIRSFEEEQQRKLRSQFIHKVNHASNQDGYVNTLGIDAVESFQSHRPSYRLKGFQETQTDPMMRFTIYPMRLSEQDTHNLRLDPSSIPSPRFTSTHSFCLPLGLSIIRAQLLQEEKLLLVVMNPSGDLFVVLDRLPAIDSAIKRNHYKQLRRDKIGREFILVFDELRKMLVVVSSDKLVLNVFEFDDTLRFRAVGSPIPLNSWYPERPFIHHACSISGTEEILLVDSHLQARIFSLVTLQFRPATLDLDQIPSSVHSTPDGSCLLVSYEHGPNLKIIAYHWTSFGSTDGIELDLPHLVGEPFVVTSLILRTAVHLLSLDFSDHCLQSYALDITRRMTEFTFREKFNSGNKRTKNTTANNCLIDCHSDVWIRFPVLAAVQRETISSASLRSQKGLMFVTDRDFDKFAPYFTRMIRNFERTSKKPTSNVLKSIKVSANRFSVFVQDLCGARQWNASQYRAGEWIVDLLCLIPIHIAVTRDNRFIPLKDGMDSPELEKSLLGADVNRIVDSISFGWYESLFQSYMSTKPVKVVSSMGEQSVGKSYALNHLVDTSFAGSAMRTTEGVWMSVTPTEKELIVALDFEGSVHSIERSAQEDTLLVLFNTAISNLVLFRNNFALSRDITGLFQSFQSSATVLDPKANPSLFQSTLVIIIKDVVEADQDEIGREQVITCSWFSLKFQKIVQDEQEANFISCLHAGRLSIIPWPVIESREFYQLFPALKKCLDQQVVTHRAAGEFLHVMKTLMAKLKANDWGAMSQTMASHRTQLLSALLPNALTFGFQEIHPEWEPLKNIDTDVPVESSDTPSQFLVVGSQPEDRQRTLAALCSSWNQFPYRQHTPDSEWIEGLSEYLEHIVNLRINHVQEWLTQNLSRFQTGHASIEELRRTFESAVVDLKGNVQLCKVQCANCQLFCIQNRFHDGQHDCQTDHRCVNQCVFCQESGQHKDCTMMAGHAGKHICVVNAHLCGEPCKLQGRAGCLGECTKVADHVDDEHICAAPVHTCGEPCELSGVVLSDGTIYSCPETCRLPSDATHMRHECEARLCSIRCQLCKRLCSNQDHMHGLEVGAIHLCGQEHPCTADCDSSGICEIETAPLSIQATFTGKHETFMYTKYSQVAKRLKCIRAIPPGLTNHQGPHCHSLDKKVVHFCENRCEDCGYFCTLPLRHPQQEHETRHGSMSRTRWMVEGPDDTALEIEGRRFSTNDEGAPMMCNLVCVAMGRHIHVEDCRAEDATACAGNDEIQHINARFLPAADCPKDFITHHLFWKRSGFKDPYSKEEQAMFSKCDSMCRAGPEHAGDAGNIAQPSYCVLPMFHPPCDPSGGAPAVGYISNDGHQFACRNPVMMQQAYHVIFVADQSSSMTCTDRRPLPNRPASAKIAARSNNRFGAVLSSLFDFWSARAAATTSNSHGARKDAYSVILFNSRAITAIEHDFARNPDQLLDELLPYTGSGGTNFTAAITEAQTVMERNWSTERSPVIVFLSDGECDIADMTMDDLCRASVRLGKAISFHAVSFGSNAYSHYLRRMVDVARTAQNNAPNGTGALPAAATVLSSYTEALDTVQLSETFLGIAESLRKPRGALTVRR